MPWGYRDCLGDANDVQHTRFTRVLSTVRRNAHAVRRTDTICCVSGNQSDRPQLTKALPHVAGIIAVAVAVLYVVGAITKVSAVSGAGFDATVVSYTPIQQLLALGVTSMAGAPGILSILILIVVTGAVILLWGKNPICRGRARRPRPVGEREFPDRLLVLLIAVVVVLLLVVVETALVWQLVMGLEIPFAAMPVFFVATFAVMRALGYDPRWAAGGGFLCGFVALSVTGALLYPAPLPEVRVVTHSAVIEGLLVSTDGDATTVGLGNCSVETIPSSQIKQFVITPRRRSGDPTLGSALFSHSDSALIRGGLLGAWRRVPRPAYSIPGRCGVRA